MYLDQHLSIVRMTSLEQANSRLVARLDVLEQMAALLSASKIAAGIQRLNDRYQCIIAPLISEYYTRVNNDLTTQYYRALVSENILPRLDQIFGDLSVVFEKNNTKKKDTAIERLAQQYEHSKIELPIGLTINRTDICPSCNATGVGGRGTMVLYTEDSEMRCEKCGHIEGIAGTIFDDNQCYSHDNKSVSLNHKRHDPNVHCTKWLYQLQAKETKVISPETIAILDARAVREFTRGGVLRSMHTLTCRQIRGWLKEMRMAKLNNHIPLLRKLITGLHGEAISPPSLTVDEEMRVLFDFAMIVEIFDSISKRKDVLARFQKSRIHNKLYYPYMLLKILSHHLRNDPRLKKLVEGIHFQSSSTIIKDDYIWAQICTVLQERGKKYVYTPTDRGALLAGFV